ncbi:hypothetical protein [Endozoicomonas sp. ALC020]|uniref:hypothetical protein n=1 Tax=unclassified Endozoicomonas TaxID=2644528 RepID=UPI003BAEDF91
MSKYSDWTKLREEISKNISTGFHAPAPVLYLLSVVIIAGGVGVWLPLFDGIQGLKSNLMTYVFALLSAILADFLMQKNVETEGYVVFVITIVVLIITGTIASLNIESLVWSLLCMGVAVLLLFLLWWLLIIPGKFDITAREIKQATVGSDHASKTAQDKSLDALMKNRAEGRK